MGQAAARHSDRTGVSSECLVKKQPQRQQHAWLAGAATVDSGASLEVRALGTHVVERGEEVGVVEGRDGQLVGGCGAALDVPPGLCHVAAPLLDLRPRAVSAEDSRSKVPRPQNPGPVQPTHSRIRSESSPRSRNPRLR